MAKLPGIRERRPLRSMRELAGPQVADWRLYDDPTCFTRATTAEEDAAPHLTTCMCGTCAWRRAMGPAYCRRHGLTR